MNILLFAFFLSPISAGAAVPSAVPSVTVSAPGANTGQVAISPSMLSGSGVNKIFSLYAFTSAGTTGNFYVLYKDGLAYATASNTKAYCFDITASSTVASSLFQLVSSQAAITNNSGTALTSGVYQGGATGIYVDAAGATANVPSVVPGVYVFGNGANVTYAAIQVQAGSAQGFSVHMDCYEL